MRKQQLLKVLKHYTVSVPIRGLFNLTNRIRNEYTTAMIVNVSVPIRGLFNLTLRKWNT